MNLNEWMQAHPDLFSSPPPPSNSDIMYIKYYEILRNTPELTNSVEIPEDAPSGVYKLQVSDLQYPGTLHLYGGQFSEGSQEPLLNTLNESDLPLIMNAGVLNVQYWNLDLDSMIHLVLEVPDLTTESYLKNVHAYVKHVSGTPTRVLNQTGSNFPDAPVIIFKAVVYRIG